MVVKFNKDILRSELFIHVPTYGDILDVFVVHSDYNFQMIVYEEAICIITPSNKTYHHIDVLRNSELGFYEAMIDLLTSVAEGLNYPGCPVDREDILALKATSLLTTFNTYDMDVLIEALLISVRGE